MVIPGIRIAFCRSMTLAFLTCLVLGGVTFGDCSFDIPVVPFNVDAPSQLTLLQHPDQASGSWIEYTSPDRARGDQGPPDLGIDGVPCPAPEGQLHTVRVAGVLKLTRHYDALGQSVFDTDQPWELTEGVKTLWFQGDEVCYRFESVLFRY